MNIRYTVDALKTRGYCFVNGHEKAWEVIVSMLDIEGRFHTVSKKEDFWLQSQYLTSIYSQDYDIDVPYYDVAGLRNILEISNDMYCSHKLTIYLVSIVLKILNIRINI